MTRRVRWLAILTLIAAALKLPAAEGAEQAAVNVWTVLLTADRAAYAPGDAITLTLEVVNRAEEPVTLKFASAQRFDFIVRHQAGQEAWRWAAGRMFAQMMGSETIPPSGRLVYSAKVERKLPPGVYTAIGRVTAQQENLTASTVVRVESR